MVLNAPRMMSEMNILERVPSVVYAIKTWQELCVVSASK